MSIRTIVWAYRRLPELNDETGLVECDVELADKLIAAEKVQDPRVGALHLKEIEALPAAREAPPVTETAREYRTTDLQPPAKQQRRK